MKFRNKESKGRKTTRAQEAQPLLVERIDTTPTGKDKVVVRLQGKWQGRRGAGEGRALLVIDADAQRQRFPAILQPQPSSVSAHGAWSASFALPAELASRVSSGAVLWVGNVAIPLPAGSAAPTDEAAPEAPGRREPVEHRREAEPDPVAGLRAELAERATAEARLRGELTEAKAELQARVASHERLEQALTQLGDEFEQLRAAVARSAGAAAERERLATELTRFQSQLEISAASREAAVREAEGLRAELERLAGELAGARMHGGVEDSAVEEAEALLAEARELKARMGRRLSDSPTRNVV